MLDKLTVTRPTHPLKAESPILVILGGTDMLVMLVHPFKIFSGRDVKDVFAAKLRLVRFVGNPPFEPVVFVRSCNEDELNTAFVGIVYMPLVFGTIPTNIGPAALAMLIGPVVE